MIPLTFLSPGTEVMTVVAEDPDEEALVYSIIGTSDEFEIDSSTGKVTTKVELDRENQDQYILQVEASDGVDTG